MSTVSFPAQLKSIYLKNDRYTKKQTAALLDTLYTICQVLITRTVFGDTPDHLPSIRARNNGWPMIIDYP